MIGETVTHYKLLDKIGEGGMGVVYRASDTRLGRQVAVKFLSARLSQDANALERFQREARAASSLNHPNICALYDIGQRGDLPFLVMELLEGTTLRRRINGAPLQLDTLIDYASQIADALGAAHAAGIIHRDIKTTNIFVTDQGLVKILDFGLAKLDQRNVAVDPLSDTRLVTPVQATEIGQTIGTVSSMSPEQARGEDLDSRSDLFSFGIVLYEMATGRQPFTARTSALIFDAILNDTPVRPSDVHPQLPAEFDHIIAKALEKDRDLRYQSAGELRADLKRLRRETDSARAKAAERSKPVAAVKAAPPSRRLVMGGMAGVVLLSVLGAIGLWWSAAPGIAIDSVAVLPFTAVGAPSDTEYLTDGITETLINGLTQLSGLRVAARSVVFRYKGAGADAQQVGRDLNVKAVVTGRITAVGDRLVIQADLMNVENGTQLWGNQYNRPASDLLSVQEEIAKEILEKLRPRLSGEDMRRATRQYTDNASAYQVYLQGRYHWNKGTIDGYRRAIEYFQQAINQDPRYALAFAGLADSNLMLGSHYVEALTEAKSAAEQALALDPTLAEAQIAMGNIKLLLDWDWPAAERAFLQGLSLNPASALAHSQYAMYLATRGRLPDAIAEVRRAADLDALSPIVNADLGWYLLYAGQTADAIAQFRKTLEFDANSLSAHRGLGIALSEDGKHADAIAALRRALTLSQNSPVVMGHLGAAYARSGNRAEADAITREMEVLAAREYVPSSALAEVAAAQGNREGALDLLARAYDEHDFSMARIGINPAFRSLRTEPRFVALLERVGLPK